MGAEASQNLGEEEATGIHAMGEEVPRDPSASSSSSPAAAAAATDPAEVKRDPLTSFLGSLELVPFVRDVVYEGSPLDGLPSRIRFTVSMRPPTPEGAPPSPTFALYIVGIDDTDECVNNIHMVPVESVLDKKPCILGGDYSDTVCYSGLVLCLASDDQMQEWHDLQQASLTSRREGGLADITSLRRLVEDQRTLQAAAAAGGLPARARFSIFKFTSLRERTIFAESAGEATRLFSIAAAFYNGRSSPYTMKIAKLRHEYNSLPPESPLDKMGQVYYVWYRGSCYFENEPFGYTMLSTNDLVYKLCKSFSTVSKGGLKEKLEELCASSSRFGQGEILIVSIGCAGGGVHQFFPPDYHWLLNQEGDGCTKATVVLIDPYIFCYDFGVAAASREVKWSFRNISFVALSFPYTPRANSALAALAVKHPERQIVHIYPYTLRPYLEELEAQFPIDFFKLEPEGYPVYRPLGAVRPVWEEDFLTAIPKNVRKDGGGTTYHIFPRNVVQSVDV